jgi:hypothetical protein
MDAVPDTHTPAPTLTTTLSTPSDSSLADWSSDDTTSTVSDPPL